MQLAISGQTLKVDLCQHIKPQESGSPLLLPVALLMQFLQELLARAASCRSRRQIEYYSQDSHCGQPKNQEVDSSKLECVPNQFADEKHNKTTDSNYQVG